MPEELIHLIYCSAATRALSPADLAKILAQARAHNAAHGVTGMLLYAEGSFFQVLEGRPEAVDSLFVRIAQDPRHRRVTRIIREPVPERAFSDWSMGYADLPAEALDGLAGTADFTSRPEPFLDVGPGRARRLLSAFLQGRWRLALSDRAPENVAPPGGEDPAFTFAFQPIIRASDRSVFAYEALIRGPSGESADAVLRRVPPARAACFHERARAAALELAAGLGLAAGLNVNVAPSHLLGPPAAAGGILEAARRCGLEPKRLTLEILESELIEHSAAFADAVGACRAAGLALAIDDFGSGHAGLTLLADFQPDFVKLDRHLVRGIDGDGPRQAIVRGVAQTCRDLGIELVAEGVETPGELAWLLSERVDLLQGYLLARPGLRQLPACPLDFAWP